MTSFNDCITCHLCHKLYSEETKAERFFDMVIDGWLQSKDELLCSCIPDRVTRIAFKDGFGWKHVNDYLISDLPDGPIIVPCEDNSSRRALLTMLDQAQIECPSFLLNSLKSTAVLWVSSNEFVGYYTYYQHNKENVYIFGTIFVCKSKRRKGIGSKMLDDVLKRSIGGIFVESPLSTQFRQLLLSFIKIFPEKKQSFLGFI